MWPIRCRNQSINWNNCLTFTCTVCSISAISYPRLQEQKNDPSVSLQYALTSQLWVLFAHSFTSFKEKMVCYNEWEKYACREKHYKTKQTHGKTNEMIVTPAHFSISKVTWLASTSIRSTCVVTKSVDITWVIVGWTLVNIWRNLKGKCHIRYQNRNSGNHHQIECNKNNRSKR